MKSYPLWKIIFILIIIIPSFIFSIPTINNSSDKDNWFYNKKINLGLDLQGGSHLLLEVKNDILIDEELENILSFFRLFLRNEKIKIQNLEIKNKQIFLETLNKIDIDKIKIYSKKNYPDLKFEEKENTIFFELSESYILRLFNSSIQQSLEIVRNRIDELGTNEPIIQRQGKNRILLQLPGIKEPERIKKLLGKTAKLTFHMVDDENMEALINNKPPVGKMIVQDNSNTDIYYLLEKRIRVGGENLVDAQPTYEQNSPAVTFRFDPLGARKFGKATSSNVGKRFAIILDNKVITAPVIRSEILGGTGVITGNFTIEEAQDIADANNLYVIKGHDYYEGIQKYHMWIAGWDDNDSLYILVDENHVEGMTPNKKLYKELWAEYNNVPLDDASWANIIVFEHQEFFESDYSGFVSIETDGYWGWKYYWK